MLRLFPIAVYLTITDRIINFSPGKMNYTNNYYFYYQYSADI